MPCISVIESTTVIQFCLLLIYFKYGIKFNIVCLFRLNGSLPVMDPVELTQFGLKQLFYQVKQGFPEVPDSVVNDCIRKVKMLVNKLYGFISFSSFATCRLATTDGQQKLCC